MSYIVSSKLEICFQNHNDFTAKINSTDKIRQNKIFGGKNKQISISRSQLFCYILISNCIKWLLIK